MTIKKLIKSVNIFLVFVILTGIIPSVSASSSSEGSAPGVVTTDGTYMYYPLGDSVYRESLSGGERKLIYRPYTYFNNEYFFWDLDATDLQYYNGYLYIGEYSSTYDYWVNIDKINLNDLSKEECEEDYVFTRRLEQGQYYQGRLFYLKRGLLYNYGVVEELSDGTTETVINSNEQVGTFCVYKGFLYYISGSWGHSLKRYNLKTEETEVLVENVDDIIYNPEQINLVGDWIYLYDFNKPTCRAKIGEWNFEILEETEEEKNKSLQLKD